MSTTCEVMPAPNITDLPRNADLERRVALFVSHCNLAETGEMWIEARAGTVILSGLVRTNSDRRLCIDCCRRVAGVVHIIDRLEVAASGVAARRRQIGRI